MKEWRTLNGVQMQVEKDVAHLQFKVAQGAFPVAVDCFFDASLRKYFKFLQSSSCGHSA